MKKFDEYIPQYLAFCKNNKNLNSKTLKSYLIDLHQFFIFIDKMNGGLQKEDINEYIAYLQQTYKIKTVKRKIASVKAFCNYLEYETLITQTPFAKVRLKLQEPMLLPRTIPFDSIEKIFNYAYKKYAAELRTQRYKKCYILRDIVVLELLFATGLRVSELCSLKREAIDLYSGTVMIYGKGAKERIIQISNSQVLAIFREYYRVFSKQIEETEYFFVNRVGQPLSDQSVRIIVNNYAKAAGLSMHITPHKEVIYKMVRFDFAYLTNCVELEEMANVIGDTENEEKRRIFLIKSENFEKVAIEIGLLWKGDEAKLISEFAKGYRKLLIELYRQQLEINYLEKQRDDDLLKRELTSEVYFAKLKEEAEKRGLFKAMDNLNYLYNRIIETKAEEKLVESMKL